MKIGVPSGKFKQKGILIVILLSKLVCQYAFHIISGNIIIILGCAIETKCGLELSFYPCRSQISKQAFPTHLILPKQFWELLMLHHLTDEFQIG